MSPRDPTSIERRTGSGDRPTLPVLVLDDRGDLARAGLPEPWSIHVFATADDALAGFAHLDPAAAVARMDDPGLDLVRQLVAQDPTLPVVVVSELPTVDGVSRAIRLGARDVVPLTGRWERTLGKALDNALAWRLRLRQGADAEVRELREAGALRQRRVDALEERLREVQSQLAAETALLAQTQRQLEVQRERSMAAERAKGRFLANVGHELHTPLNAILGYAEMLGEGDADPAVRSDAGHIIHAARKLMALVGEVLHLARLEAGQVNPVFQPVSVEDLVRLALDRVAPAARTAGVELVAGHQEVSQIVTDPDRLLEALGHLLDNAVKFSARASGGGRVEITVRAEGDDRPEVVLAVTDDGVGVGPGDIERIFEAFTQADGSATRQHGGTGLGLAVANQLVRVVGGRITAESRPGQGSTFCVRLPEVAVTSIEGTDADLTVLVVDDDPVLRTLLQRMLLADGHRAIVTGSASTAMDLARAHHPGLIALDLNLPGRDGWDVLAELRADPGLCDIPVVILSVDGDAEQALQNGARAFLAKPVDRSALREVVARHARMDAPAGLVVRPSPPELAPLVAEGVAREVDAADLKGALASGRVPWVLVACDAEEVTAIAALDAVSRWGRGVAVVTVDDGLPDEERQFLERRLHAVLPAQSALERLRALHRARGGPPVPTR